jgi:hypothetical protein
LAMVTRAIVHNDGHPLTHQPYHKTSTPQPLEQITLAKHTFRPHPNHRYLQAPTRNSYKSLQLLFSQIIYRHRRRPYLAGLGTRRTLRGTLPLGPSFRRSTGFACGIRGGALLYAFGAVAACVASLAKEAHGELIRCLELDVV